MKKGLTIALAVLMVFGLTTVATADLPPYQGDLASSTITNWSGSGHFWGSTDYSGISEATFDTGGAWCTGSYKANTYTSDELGMELDMLGTQFKGRATSEDAFAIDSNTDLPTTVPAYIEYTQNRVGPTTVWYGASAPGGQLSESWVSVWNGIGEVAMTTMTGGSGTLNDNNLGGPKCSLGGHYAAQLVAEVDIDTGYYEMNRYIEASDGDNIDVWAQGAGHAYMESLVTNMSTGQVTTNNLWPADYHAFNATTGWGNFYLEGSGTNRVTKHLGFSTSGLTTWSAIDGSDGTGFYNNGDGTQGSAFLGIYSTWTNGFNISSCEMTAE